MTDKFDGFEPVCEKSENGLEWKFYNTVQNLPPGTKLYTGSMVREIVEKAKSVPDSESVLERFIARNGFDEIDSVERLRFFCSLAMKGQDWLDVESFFDAIIKAKSVPDGWKLVPVEYAEAYNIVLANAAAAPKPEGE